MEKKMKEITFEDIQKVNDMVNPIKLEKKNKKTGKIEVKEYVEVNQRIKAFRALYPQGFIETGILSNHEGVCVIRAVAGYYGDDGVKFVLGTGTAYEKENSTFINQSSYIENCETSAVGRALGMAGLGIDTSIASAEEVANAILNQSVDTKKTAKKEAAKPVFKGGFMDEAKLKDLLELAKALNWTEQYLVSAISKKFGKQPAELTESEYHKIVQGMTGEIANGKAEGN